MYVEQSFEDNSLTAAGSIAHDRVDSQEITWEGKVRIERSIDIFSDKYGLIGKTDVVEFHPSGVVYPIEYKHGKRHDWVHDNLQLCAQALCLEEMLNVSIPKGAIYHTTSNKRREVNIDSKLRSIAVATINEIRNLYKVAVAPLPVNDKRCPNCSLIDICVNNIKEIDWHPVWNNLFDVSENQDNSL